MNEGQEVAFDCADRLRFAKIQLTEGPGAGRVVLAAIMERDGCEAVAMPLEAADIDALVRVLDRFRQASDCQGRA